MRLTAIAILCVLAAVASARAKPFTGEGFYTLDIPEPWSAAPGSGPPMLVIRRSGAEYRGAIILVSLATSKKPLDETLAGAAYGDTLSDKQERTVDGAPCLTAKRTSTKDFVADVLMCSVVFQQAGAEKAVIFGITSTSTNAQYADQHAAFEAVVQSVKWAPGTTPGPR